MRAMELAPGSAELLFWGGLGLAQEDVEAGSALVSQAIETNPGWVELLARLAPNAPAAEAVRLALGGDDGR
jgi:hypothetical protein